MPTKTFPAMRFLVAPLQAQRRWVSHSMAVADSLADLQRGESNDDSNTIIVNSDLRPAIGAGNGGHILDVTNLKWWDVFDDQDQTRMCGYTVAPRRVPLNNIMQGDTSINPPPDVTALVWNVLDGSTDAWQTCLPDREPVASAIKFCHCAAGVRAGAVTDLHLPRNQQWAFELQLMGAAPDGDPWIRLTWGKGLCLYWRPGQDAVLGSRSTKRGVETTSPLRRGSLGDPWGYQPVSADMMLIGERMVIDGQGGRMVYTSRTRNSGDPQDEGRVNPLAISKAPLTVDAEACSFILRIHEVAHSDTTLDVRGDHVPENNEGSFRRKFYISSPIHQGAGYANYYYPAPDGKALGRDRTQRVTVEIEPPLPRTAEQHYKATIKANVARVQSEALPWRSDGLQQYAGQAMRGDMSPLAHAVVIEGRSQGRYLSTAAPLDITPAIRQVTETCGDPELQAGNHGQVEGDRNLLRDLEHPAGSGAGSVGNDWANYVNDYHTVQMDVAWVYDDGVQRAYLTPTSAPATWVTRFYGYIIDSGIEAEAYNKREFNFAMRDPIGLLDGNNGVIDQKAAALDFLYMREQALTDPGTIPRVWGADAVPYMLRTHLGVGIADALQVYYMNYQGLWNDAPRTLDGLGQPDLYMWKCFTEPPSGAGFTWPPQFGRTYLEWIKEIAQTDFATFWCGPSIGDPSAVAFCYGNYYDYVGGRPITRIADAYYTPGDENNLMRRMRITNASHLDFNRFLAWGRSPAGESMNGLMPALPAFSAEAVIDDSLIPEQNVSMTWPRTQVVQGTHFWLPMMAQRYVENAKYFYRGIRPARFAVVHRGIEGLWWGDRIQFAASGLESDPDTKLVDGSGNPISFRNMRTTNTWNFGAQPTWTAMTVPAEMWQPTGTRPGYK